MQRTVRTSGLVGEFEPYLGTQLLRGCSQCGTAHPIVLKAADTTVCPKCGHPSIPPSEKTIVPASINGFAGIVSKAFFRIAKWLRDRAERI